TPYIPHAKKLCFRRPSALYCVARATRRLKPEPRKTLRAVNVGKERPDEPVRSPAVSAARVPAAPTALPVLPASAAGRAVRQLLPVSAEVFRRGCAPGSPARLLLPDLRHRPHVRGQRRHGVALHVRLLVRTVHQP